MNQMELQGRSLDELEAIYRDAPLGPSPAGNYRGTFLRWLHTPGAQKWYFRLVDGIMFQHTRFGVDFERRVWWFVRPSLAAGRFVATPGRSRWRDTDTFRLEYGVSRLPVRGLLYDEVKPLTPDICLGVGGINAGRGRGEHFFFALTRS